MKRVSGTDLVGIVENQDRYDSTGERIRAVVKGGMVHATHLENLCARRVALLRRVGADYIHTEASVSSADRIVWEMGRACEKHVRKQLIAGMDVKKTFGIYKCKCGAAKIERGYSKVTAKNVDLNSHTCNTCGGGLDHYHELPVKIPFFNAAFGIDFSFLDPNDRVTVVEIKSIKHESFLELKKPLAPNVKQTIRYVRALQEFKKRGGMEYEVNPNAYIFYASKGVVRGFRGKQYKQFVVNRKAYPIQYDSAMSDLKNGRRIGLIDDKGFYRAKDADSDGLPEKICETTDGNFSKKCDVCSLCFALSESNK